MAKAIPQHNFRVLFGLALGFALASCVAATQYPAPPPPPQCLPMATYTQAQQDAALIEYTGLPPHFVLRRFMLDYEALRDANRAACGQARALGHV